MLVPEDFQRCTCSINIAHVTLIQLTRSNVRGSYMNESKTQFNLVALVALTETVFPLDYLGCKLPCLFLFCDSFLSDTIAELHWSRNVMSKTVSRTQVCCGTNQGKNQSYTCPHVLVSLFHFRCINTWHCKYYIKEYKAVCSDCKHAQNGLDQGGWIRLCKYCTILQKLGKATFAFRKMIP